MMLVTAIGLGAMAFLGSCIRHPVSKPAATIAKEQSYLDLKRGDRLRVVLPLRKAQDAGAEWSNVEQHGASITLSASQPVGFQIVKYQADGGHRGKVKLRFVSSETMIDGKAFLRASAPELPFRLPDRPGHLRLIYLVRVSQADHNMAIMSAPTMEMLNSFTNEVMRNAATCGKSGEVFCEWVPTGVAVRPET